jgi:ribosomal protein S18 acetylase RimI-like enzyme
MQKPKVEIKNASQGDLEQLASLFDGYRQFYRYASDITAACAFIRERLTTRYLTLETARTNLTAQSLYESCGWKRDQEFYGYELHLR